MYLELHAASAFSFLDGASLPEALIERAASLGYPAVALLDRDGVHGIPRFHLAARRAGLKAIVGAELTLSTAMVDTGRSGGRGGRAGGIDPGARIISLPVLVASREGYRNLCRLVTRMKLRSPKGEGALTLADLDGHVGGLVALAGRTAIDGPRYGIGGLVDRLVGVFGAGGVAIELQRHLLREEESDNHALSALASAYHLPVVATNGVRFAEPADRPLYDVLTCIRHKTTLERAGRRLSWNAERYLKPPEAMARLFADRPDAIAGTQALAERLEYTMADLGYRFPDYPVPAGETMASFLRKMTEAGACERYRPFHERARRQVARELDLIEKLDLAGYFLIVWDIVNYCRQAGILVQGRGSAANSAVCYSLGITAVDPVGMDLLFERFLSEERGEWPDIDLDLPSGDRRERVIQHLYDKYGRSADAAGSRHAGGDPNAGADGGPRTAGSGGDSRVAESGGGPRTAGSGGDSRIAESGGGPRIAESGDGPRIAESGDGPRIAEAGGGPRIAMTANVITYRGRSAAREVGKALSIDAQQVDRLAKIMNHFEWVDPKETLARNLRDAGIDVQAPAIQLFGQLWQRIQDLPRHLGQHSGGMVICHGRLDDVVPLENASMPDRVVVQWDKDDCADMGLVKVDLLGLGMMAVLQDALHLVNTRACGPSEAAERSPAEPDRLASASGGGAPRAPEMMAVLQDALHLVNTRACGPSEAAQARREPGPGVRDPEDGRPPDLPPESGSHGSARREPGSGRAAPLVDLAHLPADDPEIYGLLQAADTIGIFQVESRAQMATLPRLRPRCFYDIVVEVAIIRPGPIVGQMVHPYLKRRQGIEPVVYPHPSLEPILARTLGVPLFQEQLLRMAMVAAGFSGGEAEELRRAFGFKRSEKRMQQIETKLRAGMARQGISGEAAEEIIRSITSFALYGFPESHAASFALLVYASAYLKVHYPAAFYTALLNNQPMGFYHPATLVKDAQRRGVRFAPVDVQVSGWECQVEADGRIRLGLMQVRGLRAEIGRTIAAPPPDTPLVPARPAPSGPSPLPRPLPVRCPKCGSDDESMIEQVPGEANFCNICAHEWEASPPLAPAAVPVPSPAEAAGPRYRSLEHFIRVTGVRRDELATLAEIGALNAFGHHRRSALWQIEQAIRPGGELFDERRMDPAPPSAGRPLPSEASPLLPMTPPERLLADYAGTSLTIGPHPMALRRSELALRGVLRAGDLPAGRPGRRVRVAGAVITRQRPGTAKGFVFLTLEDETGIANIIVRPDLFTDQRPAILGAPYVIVEGTLQIQEGVTSVKAERVVAMGSGESPTPQSHDFH